MGWELHQAAELRRKYGTDPAVSCAEWLRGLLERNGLPLPRFPGMAWAGARLPGGEPVAVGVAQGEDGPLAYVLPAGRVEFDRTEAVIVEDEGPGGPRPVTLHWFTPRR